MIKVYEELSMEDFPAWSGAEDTLNRVKEFEKTDELQQLAEELFPDGASKTDINDWLWFDDESIFQSLGIPSKDEENDEAE